MPGSEIRGLLEFIRQAKEPNRELDGMIAEAVLGARLERNMTLNKPLTGIMMDGGELIELPPYTASIDAAVALAHRTISGMIDLNLGFEPGRLDVWPAATVRFYPAGMTGKNWHGIVETAPTAPLAILAALLSALIAQDDAGRAALQQQEGRDEQR